MEEALVSEDMKGVSIPDTGSGSRQLAAMIDMVAPRCVDAAVLSAPAEMLMADALPIVSETMVRTDGSGWMILPQDYLRLVAFRMSDWQRTLTGLTSGDTLTVRMLKSGVNDIRMIATAERPVIWEDVEDRNRVICFAGSTTADATPATALYMPGAWWDARDSIEVPAGLLDEVIERCKQKLTAGWK